ncbi:MAG TPA: BamA/TamA family outer membrane protein [Bacteroidia bacterium]|nr:BamA/TamA family outer membrane protein [Bacteroidia bacterium]
MLRGKFLTAFCLILFALLKVQAQDTLVPPKTPVRITNIVITGNKTTKPLIILRELTFHVGDTMLMEDFEIMRKQSEKNLLNTSLFNFVTITSHETYIAYDGTSLLEVTIDVKERWYTWPAPVFDVMEQNLNTWWRNGHTLDRATYGFLLTRYNFRGRRETVALICRFGYSQQFGGQYSIPYINKKQTIGISFTGLYTRNHEVFYRTQNNQLVFYKDTERHIRKETSGSVKLTWRKGIYRRHTLETKFIDLQVNDTVLDLANDYFVNGSTRMRYFTLSYQYVLDYRDARYYPLKGHYLDVEVTRHGLGILPGEDVNVTFVAASYRKWFPVAKRIFAGAMVRGRWLPGNDPPYYHQRALGFSTYVRGYEYYVIDGQSYVIAKTSLRYQLLKPRTFKFKWLPLEKFNMFHVAVYTGIFYDGGYVDDRASVLSDGNALGNTWLSGYGAGVDIVTYYDIVFRLEYTFNHLGEGGFFVHFGAPF